MIRFLPFTIESEWLIIRSNFERMGPYDLKANAIRDFAGWRNATLYQRRVIRFRWQLVKVEQQ